MQDSGLDVERLIRIQHRIGEAVLRTIEGSREPVRPRLVVGLDAAYSRRYGAVGVAAALRYDSLVLEGYGAAVGEPPLPYIPGLLAFREAPVLYTALRMLPHSLRPDLLVVDGHGLGHPRLAGIASHIGLALGTPSIGVAKKRLYGVEEPLEPGCEPPCVEARLLDKRRGITLGYVVRSTRARRLYVTPGAYVSPETAARLVVDMLRRQAGGKSLPAPTREADRLSKRIARGLDSGAIRPEALRAAGLDRFLQRSGR